MVFPSAITKGPFMVPVNLAIEHVHSPSAISVLYGLLSM